MQQRVVVIAYLNLPTEGEEMDYTRSFSVGSYFIPRIHAVVDCRIVEHMVLGSFSLLVSFI